jgi:XTP/dITP diphosphohydrolase
MADDSGLCVAALDGAPGVASAHAAGAVPAQADREATRRAQDAANNAWLLQRLQGVADRRARFVSTLVALRSADDPEPLIAFGRWEGEVLAAPRGEGGFGYDPLMFIPALGATVAELPAALKNAHSHRALAAAQMLRLMHEAWSL